MEGYDMKALTLAVAVGLLMGLGGCDEGAVHDGPEVAEETALPEAPQTAAPVSAELIREHGREAYKEVQARFDDLERFLSRDIQRVRIRFDRPGSNRRWEVLETIEDASEIAEIVDGLLTGQHYVFLRTPVGLFDRASLIVELVADDGDVRNICVFPTGYAVKEGKCLMDRFSSRRLTATLVRRLSAKGLDTTALYYDWDALANGDMHDK